jgi:predicted nucleic acid-binding Zn ribbon protein
VDIVCPSCSAKIAPEDRFCQDCGLSLPKEQRPAFNKNILVLVVLLALAGLGLLAYLSLQSEPVRTKVDQPLPLKSKNVVVPKANPQAIVKESRPAEKAEIVPAPNLPLSSEKVLSLPVLAKDASRKKEPAAVKTPSEKMKFSEDDVARYNKLLADYLETAVESAENAEHGPMSFKEWIERDRPNF